MKRHSGQLTRVQIPRFNTETGTTFYVDIPNENSKSVSGERMTRWTLEFELCHLCTENL